ncbi:hypothetical protein KP509_29G009800 [Ceratopteris richardii]|uniref:PPM-type phosphatase domain-containing protein n=1 Tax=Ceratopteris richardii TaxID=49495 RepID=A0A8T2R6S9_CERRI|nr:hypothetical protein KP509_29G009800 [Ceratopteris richardii]
MGNSVSHVVGCFAPATHDRDHIADFFTNPALDEGLGHSFCYVRPSSEVLNASPSHSDRYTSELRSSSFRSHKNGTEMVAFKTISGASVSANTSTPHTILSHEHLHSFANVPDDRHAAFESTGSFVSIPLQPVPRGVTFSGPISSTFSGPISASLERGFMSGPLERSHMSGPIDTVQTDHSNFSAPLSGSYYFNRSRRRRNPFRFFRAVRKPAQEILSKSIYSTLARTQRSIVAPLRHLVRRRGGHEAKETNVIYDSNSEHRYTSSDVDVLDNQNLQWAQGKAGEDRVHVVVSEDNGWLFVGIYDGFNGPDAPDFLMRNLYRGIYKELHGILWDAKDQHIQGKPNLQTGTSRLHGDKIFVYDQVTGMPPYPGKLVRSRTLKEFLESADSDDDISVNRHALKSERYHSFSMPLTRGDTSSCSCGADDSEQNGSSGTATKTVDASSCDAEIGLRNGRMPFRDKLAVSTTDKHSSSNTLNCMGFVHPNVRHKHVKNKESHRKLHPQRHGISIEFNKLDKEDFVEDGSNQGNEDAVDHGSVLMALARALEATEEAYLNMADVALKDNPELLLMGSCILVALVKDKDVYILNVGDSRALVAQEAGEDCSTISTSNLDATKMIGPKNVAIRKDAGCIPAGSHVTSDFLRPATDMGCPTSSASLLALQLSEDHSTSIAEEVERIKLEHPDDNMCILNDRVKGRLKVTRAFGAGYLKKPRWNNAVLKMFQIDYVGSDPYISCAPALRHHRLGPNDRFLVLSSDGLYQYFSNTEVVSHIQWFMQRFPEGDPAQLLIEELLFRAAKKAGMDFHELLDIPQGDRRKYHDDVSVMVISLDGKVWKSSS